MSVNKVILVGNVGKDPETRYLDESTAITKFPMATSETYKNRSGERITNTEWHNVVLWRGLAQVAEKYVKKGTQIYIEGRIKTRSYDDADGNRKYITEIVGDQMQLLGRRPDEGSAAGGEGGQAGYSSTTQAPASGGSATGGQAPQSNQNAQGGGSAAGGQAPGAGGSAPGGQSAEGGPDGQGDPFDGGNDGPDDLPF
jgi:single-strand DNA-binding protein